MPRYRTLKQIDKAGYDIRLWCFDCARGAVVDGIWYLHFQKRKLPSDIIGARYYFPCRHCGSRTCLLVPATPARSRSIAAGTHPAVAWFHAMRGASKQRNRP